MKTVTSLAATVLRIAMKASMSTADTLNRLQAR